METSSAEATPVNWQENKALAETNLHMLEEEILCDVTFLAGESKTPVKAHKFMLVSRSPVFYAMFCGPLAESKDAISVPDIEPKVLNMVFRYMYTDNSTVSDESVMALLYAAQKYAVTNLVKECRVFLKEHLGTDAVCTVLQQAITYDERELIDDCLAYIMYHVEDVFKSEDFKRLDRQTLKKIIEEDSLAIQEEHVYTACVCWAKHQCESEGKETSDQNIKECLGEILYLIRFPTMPIEIFTNLVSKSHILTDSEKVAVFQSYGNKTIYTHTFPICPRISEGKHVVIERFDGIAKEWNHSNQTDAIAFTCSEDVQLVGVCLFTPISMGSVKGPLEILEKDRTIYKEEVTLSYADFKQFEDIIFERKLQIEKGKIYTVKQTFQGTKTFYGETGKGIVNVDQACVEFYKSAKDRNSTSTEAGQFYRLLFHWVKESLRNDKLYG